jgi:hypothetical protein
MALFIFQIFSFIAARSNQLTSYLMFAEDYIQRSLFVKSRGLSRAGLVVLLFSLLHGLASLYSTLLWALDSPGYVFRTLNATVADYDSLRSQDPPYIVQLKLDAGSLRTADDTLVQVMGSDLFKPGLNYTLTGESNVGTPEIATPTRHQDVGARIWLDSEGFSVSTDTLAMWPGDDELNGEKFPLQCITLQGGSSSWNCTFNNTFSQGLMQEIIGKPEIHWDDESDRQLNSRYLKPSRTNNVWTSFGAGGGSGAMMQVFTVTKGTRRHTFVESVFRATMLTSKGTPFPKDEVDDLVRRSWGTKESERKNPRIDMLVGDMMRAQDRNVSYNAGMSEAANRNLSVLQSSWGFLTITNSFTGEDLFSAILITRTNITLIRSETLDEAPTAFEPCDDASFQNEAFGGKVAQTDCAGTSKTGGSGGQFFGQVDTAAVLIVYGLGYGRSNLSSESLDEAALVWFTDNLGSMASLLIARAYVISINPALVGISVKKLIVAMSALQLFLSVLTVLLGGVGWVLLTYCADAHWSSTFLANLLHTTAYRDKQRPRPGYMRNTPELDMRSDGGRNYITVSGQPIVLQEIYPAFTGPLASPETVNVGSPIYRGDGVDEKAGTGLLSSYREGP